MTASALSSFLGGNVETGGEGAELALLFREAPRWTAQERGQLFASRPHASALVGGLLHARYSADRGRAAGLEEVGLGRSHGGCDGAMVHGGDNGGG